MRNLQCCVAIWAALSVGLPAAAGELRKWTATQGGFTTEAEFVALKPGDVVSLRLKDGQQRDIPLDKLCDADRAYVRQATGTSAGSNNAGGDNAGTAAPMPTGPAHRRHDGRQGLKGRRRRGPAISDS